MTIALEQAFAAFLTPHRDSTWHRLLREACYRTTSNAGRHPPGSQPPIKLSVVSLVIEVATAARETADDLTGHHHPTTPGNLWRVYTALSERPDADLVDWWTDALHGWNGRAQGILAPPLLRWLHGAQCPHCLAQHATTRQDGERVRLPAIGVTWADDLGHHIHTIDCRNCGAMWERNVNLGDLVAALTA